MWGMPSKKSHVTEMTGRGDMISAGVLTERLHQQEPVNMKSTLAEPAVIMAEPDAQEAFILALHERVVELESFAATMEKRRPELPPSGFRIRHNERGWIFGVTMWEEGWPQSQEGFCKLGEQLLGEFSTKLGGLEQWTTLSLCAHDMLEARRANIGLCLAFQQAFDNIQPGADQMKVPDRRTMRAPDLSRLVAKRITLVEGCVKSLDPRLAPEHIAAGLESVFGVHLLQVEENPEALTTQGRTKPTDLTHATCGTRKVQQVAMPQLWDDLVKAAYGKDIGFSMGHGDPPEASLPDSDDEIFTFERTSENVARVAMAAVQGDLDDFPGLDHPAIARNLQQLMPAALPQNQE